MSPSLGHVEGARTIKRRTALLPGHIFYRSTDLNLELFDMKVFLLSAAMAVVGSAALAKGELTCWYDDAGRFAGADTGNWPGGAIGETIATAGNTSGAWAFVMADGTWTDGNSCPASVDIPGQSQGFTADWSLDPAYGSVTLNEGFLPDPHIVNLDAGGPVVIENQVSGCYGGNIAEAPDYRLQYNSGGNASLTFSATSQEDLTLVINAPTGEWICVDDVNGTDPEIYLEPPVQGGQYDIWVGTFNSGIIPPATLSISELNTPAVPTGPATSVGTIDRGLPAGFGAIDLTQGFLPDPHVVELAAGGSVSTSGQLNNCFAGFVAEAPDISLFYTVSSGSSLRISAYSDADTTLLVMGPNGELWCVDDTNGLDPEIYIASPAPGGEYDIWVGTLQSGFFPDARLEISEF